MVCLLEIKPPSFSFQCITDSFSKPSVISKLAISLDAHCFHGFNLNFPGLIEKICFDSILLLLDSI